MRFPVRQAKKFIILMLVVCSLSAFSFGQRSGGLSLSLTLTRGERSRDSHTSTTTITINQSRLVYDKTYSGYNRSRRQPVHKEFQLTSHDIESLKSIIKANGLLKSGSSFHFPNKDTGYAYFEIAIQLTLDNHASSRKLYGPASMSKIKDEWPYKSSIALVKEVFRLINNQDQEIKYEELVD